MIFIPLCKKTRLFPSAFILILFLAIHSTEGQETNYWFNNYGASSFLKGGIVVANTSSNSAIFYNPGALAFFEGQSIEAQADLITLDAFTIKNGAGDNIPIKMLSLDVAPSLIGYSFQSKNKPKFVYGFGVFTKNISNITYNIRHETEGNYVSSTADTDIFHGELRYRNRVTENWVNGTIAYKSTPKLELD